MRGEDEELLGIRRNHNRHTAVSKTFIYRPRNTWGTRRYSAAKNYHSPKHQALEPPSIAINFWQFDE